MAATNKRLNDLRQRRDAGETLNQDEQNELARLEAEEGGQGGSEDQRNQGQQ